MEVRDLGFGYEEERLFSSLSFSLSGGRHVAVMGESGKGKTTLLKLLLGFIEPMEGEIIRAEGEKPAVVFQEDRLLPWFSALKNVQLAGGNAEELLEDMELRRAWISSRRSFPEACRGGRR